MQVRREVNMSQCDISQWAYETFNKRPGIFLEAGSSCPIDQSNTKFLEDMGWSGMCVEPLTRHNETYTEVRPRTILENYALVGKDYDKKTITGGEGTHFHCSGVTPCHTGSTRVNIRHEIEWPACQLEKLLKKHEFKNVDFFSLDTEGFEHQVLDGIDFNYTKFNLILIEYHDYTWTNKTNDFSYLEKYGYIYRGEYPNGHHKIYTHNTFIYDKN